MAGDEQCSAECGWSWGFIMTVMFEGKNLSRPMPGVDRARGGILKGTEFTEPGTSLGQLICALKKGGSKKGRPHIYCFFSCILFEIGSHGHQANLKTENALTLLPPLSECWGNRYNPCSLPVSSPCQTAGVQS